MKRTFLLLAIFVFFLVLLSAIQNRLRSYDFFIIESDYKPVIKNIYFLRQYKQQSNIVDLSIYASSKTSIKYGRNEMNVSSFEVDPYYLRFKKIKMISGRFISEKDINQNSNNVVIQKSIAIQIFANRDCIGKKIYIGDTEYTIIGLYEQDTFFLDALSSTHHHIVYVPLKNQISKVDEKDNEARILIRPKPGSSVILENTIQTNIGKILSANATINNLDASSLGIIQKISLSKIFILVLFYYHNLKIIYANIRNDITKIKAQLEDAYFKEVLMRNIKGIAVYAIVLAAYVIVFLILCNFLKFDFFIDPNLIPKSLIDITEIKNSILRYYHKINTTPKIISCFSAFIVHAGNFSNIIIIILFVCYCSIIKKQKELMQKILSIIKSSVSGSSF